MTPSIGVPVESLKAPAYLNRNHIDGPLLSWGGRLHWLTMRERLALWLRLQTLSQIAASQWPEYRKWHEVTK